MRTRTRERPALTGGERRTIAGMAAVVVGLHVVGFFVLIAVVVPQHLRLGAQGAYTAGVGLTAYTLGLRHAFDADHIAAIDNTTRRLMRDGRGPLSVGFWFSLGHSTVVFALAILFAVGLRGLGHQVQDGGSRLHDVTGMVGTTVSGTFLLVIGLLNLSMFLSTAALVRRMRRGALTRDELDAGLRGGGIMTRLYGRVTDVIRRPWQMYPLGILFGVGFDTASEIALLLLAAGATMTGLPWYAILCLPVLFAAGMSLLDTIDGAFMNRAYGWALVEPERKLYYNLTVTGLSVAVALLIATMELLSVLAARLHLSGGVWDLVTGVDVNLVGFAVVGLFAAAWLVAVTVARLARGSQRWNTDLGRP